jgi:hypothetical protein
MSVFQLYKWAIRRIDKIRRNFLWKGSKETCGRHCMSVGRRYNAQRNWADWVCSISPSSTEQWQQRTKPDKPCSNLPPDIDEIDAMLFRECTTTAIGNGTATKFWMDRWLEGCSLKEIAPAIYKLARRKNYTVAQGLEAGRWKQGLQRISTTEQLMEYTTLWTMIAQVQQTERLDKISWKFTANGSFSTSSAYRVQFIGSYADYAWSQLWKAKVENKCKFHSWILLRNKLWIADRIN